MTTKAIGKIVAWYLLTGVSGGGAMAVTIGLRQFDWATPADIFLPFLGGLLTYLALLVVAGVMTPNLRTTHRSLGFLVGVPLAMLPLAALAIAMYPG